MDPNATQHYVIPKEFEGGTRKIRFPGAMGSVGNGISIHILAQENESSEIITGSWELRGW